MGSLLPDVDPNGLLEYSVVFTYRSLNHMSQSFQGVMRDISTTLKRAYGAEAAIVVPGGGTYAMEAVARQFASDKKCLVIRNGFFSFRWSQIFDAGNIPAEQSVLMAQPVESGPNAALAPCPIEDVLREIDTFKPDLVFAPHVETASGMIIPDDYLASVAEATHKNGGMFVLDCIASGAMWVDMREVGVDILISAPQKGWSASPCSGFVMLGADALERIASTSSSSFACDLKKWMEIMTAYENGGHAYHATMPTDALVKFSESMKDTVEFGFDELRAAQEELGTRVRALLDEHGFKSVAASGFQAPTVIVCYTDDVNIHNGSKFVAEGLQIAAGVPLMVDEPADYRSFRIGLFGIEKLKDIDRSVQNLKVALEGMHATR
jgi:aspartate aminotransferase-like enzyme